MKSTQRRSRLRQTRYRCIVMGVISILIGIAQSAAVAKTITLNIRPSATDATIKAANDHHVILRDVNAPKGRLLIWLTGTGGTPAGGAGAFLDTAVTEGYRVIALSYIDTPAVAQICRDENLRNDDGCAAKFRQKRAFGDDTTPLIQDRPQDSIVHRLTALLTYLAANDEAAGWDQYLDNGAPNWAKIVLTGQSQGGGMAAYIAKRHAVAGVIDFSGGWDFSAPGKIAGWYALPTATPAERWFGTLNKAEGAAAAIFASYQAMKIPDDQILILSAQSRLPPHSAGCCDPIYKDVWRTILRQR